LHKADEPDTLADLSDADVLSREGMTQVDLPPLITDSPAVRLEDLTYPFHDLTVTVTPDQRSYGGSGEVVTEALTSNRRTDHLSPDI
jgi:hypothetical protein